jgi:hypothetical protein
MLIRFCSADYWVTFLCTTKYWAACLCAMNFACRDSWDGVPWDRKLSPRIPRLHPCRYLFEEVFVSGGKWGHRNCSSHMKSCWSRIHFADRWWLTPGLDSKCAWINHSHYFFSHDFACKCWVATDMLDEKVKAVLKQLDVEFETLGVSWLGEVTVCSMQQLKFKRI